MKRKESERVHQEWREEMESKSSLRIYRRFKTEMKGEDFEGGMESRIWFGAITRSLRLGYRRWNEESMDRV